MLLFSRFGRGTLNEAAEVHRSGWGAAARPLAARAQRSEGMRRVGVLENLAEVAQSQSRIDAFLQALQQSGWIVGRNLQEWRAATPAGASREGGALDRVVAGI